MVIGGLVSSTVLTLVLNPTLYTMVEGRRERRQARRNRRRPLVTVPPQRDTTESATV
ncbi:hypothetical protein [Streptomyces adustus]